VGAGVRMPAHASTTTAATAATEGRGQASVAAPSRASRTGRLSIATSR
jgi:hypothetical protein